VGLEGAGVGTGEGNAMMAKSSIATSPDVIACVMIFTCSKC